MLYPTDTVYGLGCDPFREETVERLTMLKGRPEGKGMLVIIDNLSFVNDICINIPNVFYELSEAFWPGPVTFLLPGTSRLSHLVLGDTGKVGVRCPDLSFLRRWSRAIPGPVVSTSANLSGLPLPQEVSELRRLFGNKVDLFLDGGEPRAVNRPSTVVDVTTTPPPSGQVRSMGAEGNGFLGRPGSFATLASP